MRYHLIAATALSLISSAAAAKPLQCNSGQTLCVVSDRSDLTIGDQVGVFNDDGQLVATAAVSRMRGNKRSLAIASRTGQIAKGDRIALLDTSAIDGTPPPTYEVYREPAKYQVGASLGYSTIALGTSVPAYELSPYVQMRTWGGLLVIGRAVYASASGETSHGDVSVEKVPMQMHGIGLLSGLGYEWFTSKPLSLRIEAAVGAMRVDATVDGSSQPVDDGSIDIHVKNGTAPYARWSIGGVYHVGDQWHAHLDFTESLVYQAFAATLVLSMSRDLP